MNRIILLIIILCIGLITYKTIQRNTFLAVVDKEENAPSDSFRYTMAIKEVKKRITNNKKYNSDISFLLDMKRPSGRNRFFVVDLTTRPCGAWFRFRNRKKEPFAIQQHG